MGDAAVKPATYPAGRHDLMIVAAVRYCLGRMTYIGSGAEYAAKVRKEGS